MSATTIYVIIFVICIALSAFFAVVEAGFLSLQKGRLRHLVKSGVPGAEQAEQVMHEPGKLLATVLFGNDLVNTVAGVIGSALAVYLLGEGPGVIVATLVTTSLVLIVADVIPKTFANMHSERVSLVLARPVLLLEGWLSPIVNALFKIGLYFAKAFGGSPPSQGTISEAEIDTMISIGAEQGTVVKAKAKMLHKIFEFGGHPVREVMTPHVDIISIEKSARIRDFLAAYSHCPHVRYPVFEGDLENIVGLLSIRDVLMAEAKGQVDNESTIASLVRPVTFTPATKDVSQLLFEMQESGDQMDIVVDEYGCICGLVTMDQLIAEVVGRSKDDLESNHNGIEVVDNDNIQLSAGMRVKEVNEKIGLKLPSGDYETMAGFMLKRLGHIPKNGEQVKYDQWRLTVQEMKGRKIERILLTQEMKGTKIEKILLTQEQ
jgi:putative hemolysin